MALIATLALYAPGLTRADPPASRVVWAHGAQAYLAPADSAAILAGDRVWFVHNGEPLGSATVTRVDARGLALAILDSGSLEHVKHLDRIEVQVTHVVMKTPARLVIGCAAPRRPGASQAPLPALVARPPAGYRADSPATNGYRLVRDTSLAAAWPETLLVRWFDDGVDEEIALERGEIDIGLFAPGELSGHMREQPRWQGYRLGTRTHDAMAWNATDPSTPGPPSACTPSHADSAWVNAQVREAYRGDLVAWRFTSPATDDSTALPLVWADTPRAPQPARPTDRAHPMPGVPPTRRAPAERLKLHFVAAPIAEFDSLAVALALQLRGQGYDATTRARADSLAHAILDHTPDMAPVTPWNRFVALHRSLGLVQLYTMRCPIVCSPELRPFADALAADSLADLIGRLPSGTSR